MRLKNSEIEPFGNFLLDMKLKGKESRMRTRLVKILDKRLRLISEERREIIETYAEKDGDELLYTEENGEKMISLKNPSGYRYDMSELMSEEFIIEENDSNKDMLLSVQKSVLEYDELLSGQDAMDYDRWCEIMESIYQS